MKLVAYLYNHALLRKSGPAIFQYKEISMKVGKADMRTIQNNHSLRMGTLAGLGLLMMIVSAGVAQSPPTLVKSFSAATMAVNGSATLTFTVTNPNPAIDLNGVGFNDNLPSGLIIANPDSLTGSCDPGFISVGLTNISLSEATVLANSSCTFAVDVFATASGTQVNTTDNVTSTEGGTGGSATASINVVSPDLTVTSAHVGNFVSPQIGAVYTITVTNSGAGATTDLVTVTDTLPAGLTATAIDGGPNWECSAPPLLQCTHGDFLDPGLSFEPITITVNVASNAGSSGTNMATVSGGGEDNTANDTASDLTQITPAIQMSAQTANLQVAAGATASTTLNVNYSGGLGAITFACSGLPAASTCSFNPTSVSAAGATPVTLNIVTTARGVAYLPRDPTGVPPNLMALLALMGLAGVALSLTRTKFRRVRLAIGLTSVALLLLSGCGGGSKTATPTPTPTPTATPSPTPVATGTPAGVSVVTVTATSASGGATATSTVNLTVQ
jgi:hypothetical protein